MKFNCGPTRQERWEKRYEWHKVFLLFPKRMTYEWHVGGTMRPHPHDIRSKKNDCRWLEQVWRVRNPRSGTWEYRPLS